MKAIKDLEVSEQFDQFGDLDIQICNGEDAFNCDVCYESLTVPEVIELINTLQKAVDLHNGIVS
jgi:hypothetical protein